MSSCSEEILDRSSPSTSLVKGLSISDFLDDYLMSAAVNPELEADGHDFVKGAVDFGPTRRLSHVNVVADLNRMSVVVAWKSPCRFEPRRTTI